MPGWHFCPCSVPSPWTSHHADRESFRILKPCDRSRRNKYPQIDVLLKPYRNYIRRGSPALTAERRWPVGTSHGRNRPDNAVDVRGLNTWQSDYFCLAARWRERRCCCSTHSCYLACRPGLHARRPAAFPPCCYGKSHWTHSRTTAPFTWLTAQLTVSLITRELSRDSGMASISKGPPKRILLTCTSFAACFDQGCLLTCRRYADIARCLGLLIINPPLGLHPYCLSFCTLIFSRPSSKLDFFKWGTA